MKKGLFTLFVTLCIMVCMNVAHAQIVKYEEHTTLDELRIEYRWQRERFFVRNSNAVLNLQFTNLSDSHLEVQFVVAYYRDGQIFYESDEHGLCLKPGQRLRGGRAGLRFVAEGILRQDVDKEGFEWDVLFSEIRKVNVCE